MNPYIADFIKVIKNARCDNTYKLAWARAIVELCEEDPIRKEIALSEIGSKMIGYYWNQIFFFGMRDSFLYHSSNPEKLPELVTYTKALIEYFIEKKGNNKPVLFELSHSDVSEVLPKVVRTLKSDVSWRFLNASGEVISIYDYARGDNQLYISNAKIISDYAVSLKDIINLRWSSVLEGFNKSTPNICKKVMLQDEQEIKRKSLNWAREYLDIQNPDHKCAICGEVIEGETPAIDHVIPWSFLYSDDLWNLVYAHGSCNSMKLDSIPTATDIKKLKNRNNELLDRLHRQSNKKVTELEMAVKHDYVTRLWKACGG